MGTQMGITYANLLLGYLEEKMFKSYHVVPEHFLRYIDDILGITSMAQYALHNWFSKIYTLASILQRISRKIRLHSCMQNLVTSRANLSPRFTINLRTRSHFCNVIPSTLNLQRTPPHSASFYV